MTDAERISNRPSGRMNGGRALAEMLRLAGVGPMFGMGGFQLLPFYDALAQLGMRHFLINDERCGAFAAEAYARVTNRPGVCDGTLGPGATNLVTGLIEALNAGTPMIALAGDTNRAHSCVMFFQECARLVSPARAIIGVPAFNPSIRPVTRLVAPGPSVPSQIPGRLVTRA